MNKSLISTAIAYLAISFSGAALASEPYEEPAQDWSGRYVGVHVGYGEANFSGQFDSSETTAERGYLEDIDLDGLIIGRALYDGKVSLEEALQC